MLPKIDTCGPAEQDPKVRNGLTQMHLPDISQRYQGRQRERRKSLEAWGEDEGGGYAELTGLQVKTHREAFRQLLGRIVLQS